MTVRRKLLRKRARKARREFEAGRAVLLRGTVIHRPLVKKRNYGSTDVPAMIETSGQRRSEPTEKCYDVKMETSEVQVERIRHQRSRGDWWAARRGRHIQISRQSSARARENDEEQAQQSRRLLGDRDVAVFADGDLSRGGVLVRESVQRGVSGPRGVDNSSPCVSQEARR